MTTEHRVTCINKEDRKNIHERIQFIGVTPKVDARAKLPLQDAITGIESGKWKFYVSVGMKKVSVIVAQREGNKYLKTEEDMTLDDNLLSLPKCP